MNITQLETVFYDTLATIDAKAAKATGEERRLLMGIRNHLCSLMAVLVGSKLDIKVNINPEDLEAELCGWVDKKEMKQCPKCGCEILDPFFGSSVAMHDVERCGGLARKKDKQ